MPLTKVFRLGPTPQRITKGYVLAGELDRVRRFGEARQGRVLSGIRVGSPGGRIIQFRTGWVLMADPDIRAEVRRNLLDAVLAVGAAARDAGLALIPSASRPQGGGPWADWTCADRHEIEAPSTTELEVVNNSFRAASGLIVALTGRAAVDGGLDRTNSSRLLHSTGQLYARYVTSASPRNIKQVADELRRASGIRGLDVMDVFPGNEGGRLECTINAIDAQAFVDTTMAHALLVAAMAMKFRRSARHGSRVGRMPDRLVQEQRSVAITQGLAGRVRLDGAPQQGKVAPVTSFELLARDLATDLLPEFGSLQATFAEIAPALGWTVDGSIPRNENEFLQRAHLLDHRALAAAVLDRQGHGRFSALGASSQVAALWENLTTLPPATRRGKPPKRTPPGDPKQDADQHHSGDGRNKDRGGHSPSRDTAPRHGTDQVAGRRQPSDRAPSKPPVALERRAALAHLKEAEEAERRAATRQFIVALPHKGVELVAWDSRAADEVKAARAAARPPAQARRTVRCAAFSPTHARTLAAADLASKAGWSLLSVEGTPEEVTTVTPGVSAFLEGLTACDGALLGVSKYKDEHGVARARLEVVLVGKDDTL